MSIEDRVSRVFVDGIGMEPGEVTPNACLKDDLGIDSTEMVEVVVALEKEFGTKIPDGIIHGGITVRDVVDYFGRSIQ
ncbi:MAG TPA: acyl carrier protein [Nitrospirota bacterium]